MKTIKYATQDTFRTLLATDNYLQKYLPFQIQSVISENFKAILKDSHDKYMKQKDFEHLKFKELHKNVMKDNGIPDLEKRGFIMPGQSQVVVNNTDFFINELGQRVVSLDWFLSRDNKPVTEEELQISMQQEGGLQASQINLIQPASKAESKVTADQQLTPNKAENSNVKTLSFPSEQSPHRKFQKHSHTVTEGKSPGGRQAFFIGLEDLDADFADQIREIFALTSYLNDEVQKLTKQPDRFKQEVISGGKDEYGKFRVEVRQALTEHYEYIKELHNEVESQLTKNKSDQNVLIGEFHIVEQEYSQLTKIRDRQEIH